MSVNNVSDENFDIAAKNMNSDILRKLRNPSKLSDSDLNELEVLVEKYNKISAEKIDPQMVRAQVLAAREMVVTKN